MKLNHLLYGTAYYSEYMPYERTKKDMEMMKKAGMNVIRIAESSWSTWEPKDGEYDFTILHHVIAAASDFGIDVIIGTPTYAIPAWLAKKYPDILAETHDGPSRYGHRQNMDITNPNYLFHAERILRRLMEQVKNYHNIIGFQLDNETKAYDTCSPYAQKKFVKWLKKKFSTLENLNDAFGLTYWSNSIHNWEDFPDIRGTINGSLGAEYECFQRKLVTDFLSWQADIVKEYAKPEQFITQNFDYDWHSYSYGLQPLVNQFEAAKSLTIPGFDIYHPSRVQLTGAEISFCGAIGRSVAKSCDCQNYLLLETQAQGNLEWLPYKNQLRLQAYSHLASGADSVLYWHWHSIHNAIESYWKGILSHDLQENETYYEVCKTGNEFAHIGERLIHLEKKSEIAIMVNHESLTGLKWFPISQNLCYNDILRWIYDAFYTLNLECDIISSKESDLSNYKLIITPALYSVSETTLHSLTTYVKNGGHLISTFKTGFSDCNLKIYSGKQPYQLTECFGISYQQFTYPQEVYMQGDLFTNSVPVSEWMELIKADSAAVWASFQHPHYKDYAAITYHSYGKGSALYLGCYFDQKDLITVIKKLCREIQLPIPDQSFPLIRKQGMNSLGEMVSYYFNYSDSDIELTYEENDGELLVYNHKVNAGKIKKGETMKMEAWNLIVIIRK